MRILMLNYEFPPLGGGASPVSYEIAKGYVSLGHSVDVITMGFKGLPFFEKASGMNIYRVPSLRSKKNVCHPWEQATYIVSAINFLRKHMGNNKYDINHTHFIIPSGIVSLWLQKRYRLNFIVTSHGSDIPGYNPDRFVFLHWFTSPLVKKICAYASCVTVPSLYLKDLLEKKTGLTGIRVIPNGSKDLKIEGVEKENIIFSSGRLLKRKGFHLLIKAFKKIEHVGWKLFIVGDGPYRKELERVAGNRADIIFTGWLDRESPEYLEIANKAKIFALLSSAESQGISYIEAMSTGCAILASSVTATLETVDEKIGSRCDHNDMSDIERKFEGLIKSENILKQFMRNSRERYIQKFLYNNIVHEYESVISSPRE
jgi:glycosyltransferase involved in cell wall biosynthesis